MNRPKLPRVPDVPPAHLADADLLDLAHRLGACKIIAERQFFALLPEIGRRKLLRRSPRDNPYLSPGARW